MEPVGAAAGAAIPAQCAGVSRLSRPRVGDCDHSTCCPQQVPVALAPPIHRVIHSRAGGPQSPAVRRPRRPRQGSGGGRAPTPCPDIAPAVFAGTTRKRCGAWPSTSTTRSSPRARTTGPSSSATAWSTSTWWGKPRGRGGSVSAPLASGKPWHGRAQEELLGRAGAVRPAPWGGCACGVTLGVPQGGQREGAKALH